MAFPPSHPARRAFTLVELLVVMAIIAVLIGVCAPALTALKNASDVNKAVYDLAGILEQSRAYAMGRSTYVYVGLGEMDVTQSSSGKQNAGVGRLVVAVVSTKDGTQGFSNGSLSNWSSASPGFVLDLVTVGKPLVFDNIHVPDLGTPPTTGGMARPPLTVVANNAMSYSLGNSACTSATTFDYPLGVSHDKATYSFTKVIQFDPQGVARIQNASFPAAAITTYLEIGLQQTHGVAYSALPTPPTTGNVAAIQIDGITGAVRLYRP